MFLNSGVGGDSWESLGLQGDQTSQSSRKLVLNIHWKDWCWSWNSSTLATWCEELTPWKRLWCWERMKAEGEENDRGWNGWMASPTWSMDMSLSKLRELVMGKEAWHAVILGVTKSWRRLSDWTELNWTNYPLSQSILIQSDNQVTLRNINIASFVLNSLGLLPWWLRW